MNIDRSNSEKGGAPYRVETLKAVLTVSELAEVLRLSEAQVRSLARRNRIPRTYANGQLRFLGANVW